MKASEKLTAIFIIVPRDKRDKAVDMLKTYNVNLSFSCLARGTAPTQLSSILGTGDSFKSVITAVASEEVKDKVLDAFKADFTKKNESVAFTVPLSSIGGRNVYNFALNKGGANE